MEVNLEVGKGDKGDLVSAFVACPKSDSESKQSFLDMCSGLFHKYSERRKPISIIRYVLKFLNNFKHRVKEKNPNWVANTTVLPKDHNFFVDSYKLLLKIDQNLHFPDLVQYFSNKDVPKKDVPELVNRYNLVMDSDSGLIKVKCKLNSCKKFPTFLSKSGRFADLIIHHAHDKTGHSGVYTTLNMLRTSFWFEHYYSKVKKVIKQCSNCDRYHKRTVKLNQSPYREWRINPAQIPYRHIFIDHAGPYNVYLDEKHKHKEKVSILLFTCMWSRSINLKLCLKADAFYFKRAFQSHVLDWGIPEITLSDLGSPIVSGTKTIKNYLNDYEVHEYLKENNIKTLEFEQYPKGNSALGSMVEACVKLVKEFIGKTVKTNVLFIEDFRYLIEEAQHYINKRPICFKEALRDIPNSEVIEAITPELLLKGYNVNSLNIAPDYQVQEVDWEPGKSEDICKALEAFNKCRQTLKEVYHDEFLQSLIHQATNEPDRYKIMPHRALKPRDIVLLKDKFAKPLTYPLGIVKSVKINDLGETTAAYVLKGATKELVFRHASSLILLIPNSDNDENDCTQIDGQNVNSPVAEISNSRPVRKAAIASRNMLADLIKRDLVSHN